MDSNQQFLIDRVRGSIEGRNEVLIQLYNNQEIDGSISKYIIQRGGSEFDVDDALLSGIINFIQRCYSPNFTISTSVEGYIFTAAKNHWYHSIKKREKEMQAMISFENESYQRLEEDSFSHESKSELRKALNQLDPKCKEVLTSWSSNMKMRQIALDMGYKSAGMARKKKYVCLNKLRELLKIDFK